MNKKQTNIQNRPLFSIVIPAYKADSFILDTINSRVAELNSLNISYEIIVVVDGYAPATVKALSSFPEDIVRIYHYEQNRGKGFAVRFGMMRAKGDYIGYVDAGADILPGNLTTIINTIRSGQFDIVVPSKWHKQSEVSYSPSRKLFSRFYNKYAGLLTGVKVSDTQVGIKFYTKEVVAAVLPRLLVKRFAFEIEFLAVASKLGFTSIAEVPILLQEDKKNSTITFFEGLRSFWDTTAVFYRLRILDYYGKSQIYFKDSIKREVASLRLIN